MLAIAMVAIVAGLGTVAILWPRYGALALLAASFVGSAAVMVIAGFIGGRNKEAHGGAAMMNEHHPTLVPQDALHGRPEEVYSMLLQIVTAALDSARSAQQSIDRLLLAVKILSITNIAIVLLLLTLR
jgi:hypothetical protein